MTTTIRVGGDTLAYTRQGAGPALVVIHGVGGHKEDWAGVAADLAARRTVLAVDMLGFGGSSRDAPDLGMAAQARAIAALLDAEGFATADVLGNSVGGWVAATFAATWPARVRRLVLADAAGFKAMFDGPPPVNFFPDDAAQMRQLLEYVFHDPAMHAEAVAQAALAQLEASGERAIAGRLFTGLVGSARLEEILPRIAAPTMVLWGEEDRLFPVGLAGYLAGLVPGAGVATIPGAGHFPQLERRAEFVACVAAFLDSAAAPAG